MEFNDWPVKGYFIVQKFNNLRGFLHVWNTEKSLISNKISEESLERLFVKISSFSVYIYAMKPLRLKKFNRIKNSY